MADPQSDAAQAIQALMGVTPTGRAEQYRRAISTMPGAWNPNVSQARRDLYEPYGGAFVAGTLLNALQGGPSSIAPFNVNVGQGGSFADFLGRSGFGQIGATPATNLGGYGGLSGFAPSRSGFGKAFEELYGQTQGVDMSDMLAAHRAWAALPEEEQRLVDEPQYGANVAAADFLADEPRAEALLLAAVMAGLPPMLRPIAQRSLTRSIDKFLAESPEGNVFQEFAPLFFTGSGAGKQPSLSGAPDFGLEGS
jgi:hypothetical protein